MEQIKDRLRDLNIYFNLRNRTRKPDNLPSAEPKRLIIHQLTCSCGDTHRQNGSVPRSTNQEASAQLVSEAGD